MVHVESADCPCGPDVEDYRQPSATVGEIARGFAAAFDTATMHQFESWKDADLYRAIDTEPEGPGQDAAIAEYVEELRARAAARARQEELETMLKARYNL